MLRIWIRIHRILMFLGLPYSYLDLLVISTDPDPSSSKNCKKTLDKYTVLFCDFFMTFYLEK